jgi:hypothetical protein
MVEISFEVVQWRTVDRVVKWLRRHHGATLVRRAEGPDARTFILSLAAGELVVHQWDTGDVTIKASTDSLMDLLQECKARFAGQ